MILLLLFLGPGSPVITSGRSTKKILKQSNDITIDIGTNITTLLGSTLTLKCPFEGDANALVEWTVDSQPIKFNKRIYTVSKNVLRIKDITFFDNGAYVCRVFNSNGNDSESTLLKISGKNFALHFACFHIKNASYCMVFLNNYCGSSHLPFIEIEVIINLKLYRNAACCFTA